MTNLLLLKQKLYYAMQYVYAMEGGSLRLDMAAAPNPNANA
jgi:hypothetical protein